MARDRKRHVKADEVAAKAAVGRSYNRTSDELARLETALQIAARLVVQDPIYAPIFRRLEREIALEKAARAEDVIERARALIAQNEIGASNSAA